MKGFLTTHKGMEDVAALEIKELINSSPKINETLIVFDIKNYNDLFKLCYKSQSAIGIYYFLHEFDYNNIFNDFKKNLDKIKFNEWLNKNTKFRVECIKNSEDKISTPEIEKKIGELIIDYIKTNNGYNQKVSLTDPEIIIFVYLIGKKCCIGLDFAGFDLSKRSYKILNHPADIRCTIGYFLVRLSKYNKNEKLIDPFSGSGTIPIEAALFASSFPLNFFNKEKFIFLKFSKFKDFDFNVLFNKLDKWVSADIKIYNIDSSMNYLNYAKKNSKIAGIGKKINFSRMDIEWLDTKFEKGKIDKIVTKLPSSKQKDIGNIYNEFFYQAEFILNKKGKMVLIGNKELIKKYSSKYKFKISDERKVCSGKKEYGVFVLAK
jgi:putative N6-adenine-specific DNA methylase